MQVYLPLSDILEDETSIIKTDFSHKQNSPMEEMLCAEVCSSSSLPSRLFALFLAAIGQPEVLEKCLF